jgi:membrane dipeptidase
MQSDAMIDPVLKPRIETVPQVNDQALQLFKESLVWDALMPWTAGTNSGHMDLVLGRYHRTGVNFVSLSMSVGRKASRDGIESDLRAFKNEIEARSDYLTFCQSAEQVRAAQAGGKLGIGFNFQETLPFGTDLENIGKLYDMGVRQAVLAYNIRNYVADGCAEPSDARLSMFGVEVVKEMNRVGMLVDGSHAGYRSTMHAMEICDAPFIFSHSNPFAIRPHYRSIKDDQILACASTGGVIGINGVGFWVGDNDASTDAIFRCLDYTVELVGAHHVGLGFDYVYDIDSLIQYVRKVPHVWPPYEGEPMVRHNYAGSEQMVALVQLMLDHGYPTDAIVQILGGNWERVSRQVWK